jgi:hypothetical protein
MAIGSSVNAVDQVEKQGKKIIGAGDIVGSSTGG